MAFAAAAVRRSAGSPSRRSGSPRSRPASRRRLSAYHAGNPEQQGLGRERLRIALEPRLPKDAFLAFLRREAEAGRAVLDGAFVRLPGHEVRLTAEDEALWSAVAPGLAGAARFRPPRVRDFAAALGIDEREVRRVLKLCGRLGRVDQIAPRPLLPAGDDGGDGGDRRRGRGPGRGRLVHRRPPFATGWTTAARSRSKSSTSSTAPA